MNRHENAAVRALKWLETKPDLTALQTKYPEEWTRVEAELTAVVEHKDHARLHALMRPIASDEIKPGLRLKPDQSVDLAKKLIRQRMAAAAIQQFLRQSLPDSGAPTVWSDRLIFKSLFFTGAFHRRLVSSSLFRVLWPLVRRPHSLMPLAESHGIYCFYSKLFIDELTRLVDGPCLEIGAGDGALSRFLRDRGVNIDATDDFSWSGKIEYPADVQKVDAVSALTKFRPQIVICSWPPSGNDFERAVFSAESVRRYIMIGSRHQFAAGNWRTYLSQSAFAMRLDVDLSKQLLPPDFGGAVYVFDRK